MIMILEVLTPSLWPLPVTTGSQGPNLSDSSFQSTGVGVGEESVVMTLHLELLVTVNSGMGAWPWRTFTTVCSCKSITLSCGPWTSGKAEPTCSGVHAYDWCHAAKVFLNGLLAQWFRGMLLYLSVQLWQTGQSAMRETEGERESQRSHFQMWHWLGSLPTVCLSHMHNTAGGSLLRHFHNSIESSALFGRKVEEPGAAGGVRK